jgi:hypothetical protein
VTPFQQRLKLINDGVRFWILGEAFLVHIDQPGGRGAAVMVDALDGSVMARAAVERVEQPWLMKEERAVEISGYGQPVEARLVWKPSRVTRSPFYPLWEISTASERVWVDQSGRLWTELTSAGPG